MLIKIINLLNSIFIKCKIIFYELNRYKCNILFKKILNKDIENKKNSEGKILIDGLWDHPHHWLRLSIFLSAAKKNLGSKIIGVYEKKIRKNVLLSLRSYNLYYEIIIPNKIKNKFKIKAKKILDKFNSIKELLNYKLENDYPLFMFYDGVLKKEFLGTIDLKHRSLLEELSKTLFLLDFYLEKLIKHQINVLVLSHPTTIRFSTLLWVALKLGKPVYILNYRNNFITIRYLNSIEDFNKISTDICDYKKIEKLTEEKIKRLVSIGNDYVNKVSNNLKTEISLFKSNKNKIIENRLDFYDYFKAENKPNILILSSCFPDFPNANGLSYLENHVDWIKTTLDFAKNNQKFNWIFKKHPAEHLYGDKTTLKKIIENYLSKNIFMIDNELNYDSLINNCDCIVTSVGSAGYELTAKGKSVIMARNSLMSSWKFVDYAKNKKQYLRLLENATKIPKPNQKKIQDAKIFACLYATSPNIFSNQYKYQFGRLSYQIWKNLDTFIINNFDSIEEEKKLISKWIISKEFSYNTFKYIHYLNNILNENN